MTERAPRESIISILVAEEVFPTRKITPHPSPCLLHLKDLPPDCTNGIFSFLHLDELQSCGLASRWLYHSSNRTTHLFCTTFGVDSSLIVHIRNRHNDDDNYDHDHDEDEDSRRLCRTPPPPPLLTRHGLNRLLSRYRNLNVLHLRGLAREVSCDDVFALLGRSESSRSLQELSLHFFFPVFSFSSGGRREEEKERQTWAFSPLAGNTRSSSRGGHDWDVSSSSSATSSLQLPSLRRFIITGGVTTIRGECLLGGLLRTIRTEEGHEEEEKEDEEEFGDDRGHRQNHGNPRGKGLCHRRRPPSPPPKCLLESVTVRQSSLFGDKNVNDMTLHLSHLKSLSLHQCPRLIKPRFRFAHLTDLELIGCYGLCEIPGGEEENDDNDNDNFAKICPSLERLTVKSAFRLKGRSLERAIQLASSKRLESITVEKCPLFVSLGLVGLACPNLKSIDILSCQQLRSIVVAVHCPLLEHFDVRGCPALHKMSIQNGMGGCMVRGGGRDRGDGSCWYHWQKQLH